MTPRCALQNSDCTRCPRQNHTANTVCLARFGHSSNVFGPTACADGPNIISCEEPPSQKALFPQGQAWTSSVGVLPALLALEDLSSAADAAASPVAAPAAAPAVSASTARGSGQADERLCDHLIDGLHGDDLDLSLGGLGHVLKIAPVDVGDQDLRCRPARTAARSFSLRPPIRALRREA